MQPKPSTLRTLDPLLYLFGHRGAIERIAATPWAWVVGVVLVLSAGIARNYDHLDLLCEPEWIWGPFAASLVSTVFIYLWLDHLLRRKSDEVWEETPHGGRSFLTFINLVWLTAPCAWLYGIPFESFTDLVTATKWNIFLLALVSLWRVFIIVRAVTVLIKAPWYRVLLFVLVPAALEMMVGSFFKSLSLVGIMGGVRLPPHDVLLKQASDFTTSAGFFTALFGLTFMVIARGRPSRPLHRPAAGFPIRALAASVLCLLVWVGIAMPWHDGVRNRHELERLIETRMYRQAVEFASTKRREDFSGIHHLPPHSDRNPYYFPLELLDALDEKSPDWLRKEWLASASRALESPMAWRMIDDPQALRSRQPELFLLLDAHAAKLRAKQSPRSDERMWLEIYEEARIEKPAP
ncbi:MAG TPA: hypothetical protein VFY13_08090 [Luteolibacter sp.]|nr:hypothetical protein [Luteolibacter sp.]